MVSLGACLWNAHKSRFRTWNLPASAFFITFSSKLDRFQHAFHYRLFPSALITTFVYTALFTACLNFVGSSSPSFLLSLPACPSCSLFIYQISVCFNLVVGSLLSLLDLCNTPTLYTIQMYIQELPGVVLVLLPVMVSKGFRFPIRWTLWCLYCTVSLCSIDSSTSPRYFVSEL